MVGSRAANGHDDGDVNAPGDGNGKGPKGDLAACKRLAAGQLTVMMMVMFMFVVMVTVRDQMKKWPPAEG